MTTEEQAANIVCFLSILFGEYFDATDALMDISPDYLVEKFERYVGAEKREFIGGLHPRLRDAVFNRYMQKWGLKCK